MGIAKAIVSRDYFCDPEFRANNYQNNMRDEQTTIGAILEMQPGDRENPCWVNGEFHARVEQAQQRQGNKGAFFTGSLVDDDIGAQIAFTAFGRKMFPPQGSLVNIGGQGISLGEYNGNLQLTIGQKATVNRVNASVAAPPARSAASPRATPSSARQNAPAGQGTAYLGVTVGMSLNNAALDMRALNPDDTSTPNPFDHEAVGKWVWQRASVYLRVAASLEAGKLSAAGGVAAPTPAPARPARPARPEPTDDGSAFGADDNEHEDAGDRIPF